MSDTAADNFDKLLRVYSPSSILSSEQFFERGTRAECWQLLPEGWRCGCLSAPASPRVASSRPLRNAQRPPKLPAAPNQAHHYFVSLGLEDSKIPKLVKVADGFVNAKQLYEESYLQLWPMATNIPSLGTKELAESICGVATSGCSGPLRLLFFAHDVDHMELTVSPKRGQKKRTAAFDAIAKICNMKHDQVRQVLQRKRNYIAMAENWGLGSLLEMGPNVTDIEKVSTEYIPHIHKFLKRYHPNVIDRLESLNLVAARVIIQGLKHYGWTFEQLGQGGSKLMELVSQYIDLQALESGQIQERDHRLSRGEQPSDHNPRKRRKGNRHPNSSARIPATVGPLHMDHAMNHNIPNAGSTVASSSVTREGSIDQLPSSRPQDNTLDELRYARQDGDIPPHLNAVDLAQENGNARLNQLNGITCNNTEELVSMESTIPNVPGGRVGATQLVRGNVVDEMRQISSSWSRLGDEFQHSIIQSSDHNQLPPVYLAMAMTKPAQSLEDLGLNLFSSNHPI
ncbi:hypothetical protein BS50DRAFT_663049 [Corynespora cassiicola Philippines]|uniref:Uncharacterized protein n=1 Tax=Corynespora cassiicola Philippines TaxID=1448308 RepID=A0A2T2N091_CORCC|nr:hypothetical protein BS50DRAFT_663049 [Corynespora cassiicola Philippines]